MKKIVMLLAATMILLGVNGQAMASFTAGDLIQVVYQTNSPTNEVATDLGSFSLTTAYTGPTSTLTTITPTSGLSTGSFSGVGNSNLSVAYFVQGSVSSVDWVSGPSTGQTDGSRKGSALYTNETGMLTAYNGVGGSQVVLGQSNLSSYTTLMDGNGSKTGTFGGFIPLANGETSLGGVTSPSGYVDSYLYYYTGTTLGGNTAGVQVADLRTFANGTTEIVGTTATPVPPSMLLMGSGLLGLFGMRRKQTV